MAASDVYTEGDTLTAYADGVAAANRWWAHRWLAQFLSDGSGKRAAADMSALARAVLDEEVQADTTAPTRTSRAEGGEG